MSLNSEEIISQTISFSSQPSLPSFEQSCNSSSSSCHYQCVATLGGSNSYISGLAVDGDSLYVASSDGHIRLWPLDMAMRQESQSEVSGSTVAVTGSSVKCLLAIGNGLVSSHQDGTIRVWRHAGVRRLALRAVLPTTADCLRTFLIPGSYVEVRRHKKRTWVHHVDAVTALALSPDGARMYSVSWDRSLKAWRLPSRRCAESVAAAHDDAINAVVAAPDGHVYTASADRTVKAWRRHPGQKKLSLVGTMERHSAAVNALALGGAGGRVLYSGSCDRSVVVWDWESAADGRMTATVTLRGHAKAVLCLAAAGDVVCSGSADKTVRVWRRGAAAAAEGYSCLAVLDGHGGAVKSLALVSGAAGCDHCCSCDMDESSSCGCGRAALVCSGSLDCDVKLWRVTVSSL
ncbi:protein JINGUBANG-like [Oryza brachyantha]|uniref:protein JINGUBANG-like n=1 Tax=Oryza brachyantha TaxID=4533 RepID=UPI001ADBFE86|nr:protein JINGUBANG-like [Oryza brachyantha]